MTARVFTPFAGRVHHVLVDVGGRVRQGEPLAIIESPELAQAQDGERNTRSALRLTDENCQRLRALFDYGVATGEDLERAEANRARASADHQRALARLSSFGVGSDSVSGIFYLRSPIAGTVVERNLTPGQEVRPERMRSSLYSPLFVIEPSRLWIDVDAAEVGALGRSPDRL